jgi:hypothetical protein
VLIAGVLAVARPIGRTIGGRAPIISPASAIATSAWDPIVDRMVRGDRLRVRLERADALVVAGRLRLYC